MYGQSHIPMHPKQLKLINKRFTNSLLMQESALFKIFCFVHSFRTTKEMCFGKFNKNYCIIIKMGDFNNRKHCNRFYRSFWFHRFVNSPYATSSCSYCIRKLHLIYSQNIQ